MKILKALTFSAACFLASGAIADGMQTQLDNIFNEMENYTKPGSFETQRRSGYFAGRYTFKTQIYDENLVSLELPSARGGCGGIDVFGGSFSFINSDQFAQLMRQVASNAKGYAFQLAMDIMCPDCMKWMNEIQTKIQKMNEALGNSCQLAQGLVNDSFNKMGLKNKEDEEYSLIGTLQGVGNDMADMKKSLTSSETAASRLAAAAPDEFQAKQGAVVMRALRHHSVEGWFTGGDILLLEQIMSMTGSIVVGPLEKGADAQGETTKIFVLEGGLLTISDLMEGAENKPIYDCGEDPGGLDERCMLTDDIDPKTKNVDIESLKERILEAMVGADGFITRIRTGNVAAEPSDQQKAILAAMPHSVGSKIFLLAPISPDAAEQFLEDSIDSITLEYIWRLVNQSFKAVEVAMANYQHTYEQPTRDQIAEAKKVLREEYNSLLARYQPLSEIENHYNEIIKNADRPRYLPVEKRGKGMGK